jgi:hypothetical protein
MEKAEKRQSRNADMQSGKELLTQTSRNFSSRFSH